MEGKCPCPLRESHPILLPSAAPSQGKPPMPAAEVASPRSHACPTRMLKEAEPGLRCSTRPNRDPAGGRSGLLSGVGQFQRTASPDRSPFSQPGGGAFCWGIGALPPPAGFSAVMNPHGTELCLAYIFGIQGFSPVGFGQNLAGEGNNLAPTDGEKHKQTNNQKKPPKKTIQRRK